MFDRFRAGRSGYPLTAAGIMFATKSFSSEIDAGTMEFLLAQPLSRRTLATTRVVALTVFLALLVASTVLPIQLTAASLDLTYDTGNLWLFGAVGLLLSLGISGIATLAACASRESGNPAGIVGGVLGLVWILHVLSANAEWPKRLEVVNLFKYWDSATIIDKGTVVGSAWLLLGGVALATLVTSVFVFSRRDVA